MLFSFNAADESSLLENITERALRLGRLSGFEGVDEVDDLLSFIRG